MANHPCEGCGSGAVSGVIACPVAASILNKGRCRRVRKMDPKAAALNLYRSWDARWQAAKGSGDREVVRFLRWHLTGNNIERTAAVLGELSPQRQVLTLAKPVVASPKSRANGDSGSAGDYEREAMVDLVVAQWERRDNSPARRRRGGRPTGKGTGNATPGDRPATAGSAPSRVVAGEPGAPKGEP